MNDSELDFVDLCSKLLKRVRKKPEDSRQPRKCENPSSSQASEGVKSRRKEGREKVAATQPAGNRSGDAASSSIASGGQRAKDKVLDRMQQFKRDNPQKMPKDSIQPPRKDNDSSSFTQPGRGDIQTFSSNLQEALPEDGDEALARRLQEELDKEPAQAQRVDLEDRGLFFCQICHRDLSHMTPDGRTQHLNRCLDKSEDSAPAPARSSGVPDCPICGKKFKSQKSRSAHLKRCSSDMGVSPAVLLQALQRQAEEGPSVSSANTDTQTIGAKRKGPSRPGLPARKKPRTKSDPLDEETMVALALSSSLQEQERERRGGKEAAILLQTESAASHGCRTPVLKWRQEAGKGRGKRKKGGVPRPPPLLLVQDAEAALTRLQERVSALLLRSRAPSPPTPSRCPSTLPGWKGAAPLWQKSSLLEGASTGPSEFFSPELVDFFTSSGSVTVDVVLNNEPELSVPRVREETPSSGPKASIRPSSSSAASTPGTGQLLVGSQALQDLMELAEDGMTLTQCGYGRKGQTTALHLSGFVQEEEEAELCTSGFLPETALRPSETHSRAPRATDQRRANRGSRRSEAQSKLASDLSSMVNNPQLSDVQLQADSGEVFFAHSFMVYARCPLLAELVHESGFGVQEEGMPAAQRVLMSDVPDQAVLALLQYLYTGHSSVPASLQPHVLELASRFDLQELQQLCRHHREEAALLDEAEYLDQEENAKEQTDQAFTELLRSMWLEGEEEDDDGADSDGGKNEGRRVEEDGQGEDTADDRETSEERVDENELEEIYEFAATQRKKEEQRMGGSEHDEDEDGESVFAKLNQSSRTFNDDKLQNDSQLRPSLDRSFDRLFSESWGVYEEGESGTSKTQSSQLKQHQSPKKPSAQLSCGTLLQSSSDNLSFSPPPSSIHLPVAGLSPLRSAHSADAVEPDEPMRRDSPGPASPGCLRKQPEPELIVLSDSSEDLETDVAVLTSRSPSPPSPRLPHNPQSYTQVRWRQTPPPAEPAADNEEPRGVDWSPGDPLDCSPEVSWLIPSTPPQPSRSTATSSTQTNSSMRRTRLFPAVSSPPASPPHVSRRPTDGVPNKSKPNASLQKSSSRDASEDSDTVAPSQAKPSRLSNASSSRSFPVPFQQDTPLHPQSHPHSSSTPLHPEHQKLPVLLPASTLHSRESRSERPTSEGMESFRPSPQSSNRRSRSNSRSPDDGEGTENQAMDADGEKHCEDDSDGETEEAQGETREAKEAESSFQLSFMAMDEPPPAFSDSWGLDDPGCFSLRLEDSGPAERSSSSLSHPAPPSHTGQPLSNRVGMTTPSPPKGPRLQSSSGAEPQPGSAFRSSPPDPNTRARAEFEEDVLASNIWDSWEEEEEEELLPLIQRVNPSAQMKTPDSPRSKKRRSLVPITPMPHYSDMDTPELKNKLNRFGVRPLPKRQMVLKLKEIHQYTHQLASSDSEDEAPRKPPPGRPGEFRRPPAPPPAKDKRAEEEEDGEEEPLSASQGSNTSSTAASEESERSNPELCVSSDGDSDSDISSSQAATRLRDRLLAVRAFILSDTELYTRILHYRPLVLSQLQQQLKAAGIRLGAAKLIDYLDSQCITFTTATPGHKRGPRQGGARAKAGGRGVRRKRGGAAMI